MINPCVDHELATNEIKKMVQNGNKKLKVHKNFFICQHTKKICKTWVGIERKMVNIFVQFRSCCLLTDGKSLCILKT